MTLNTEKNLAIAYLFWGFGLFGFCGVHRFYLGKPITGFLWVFSGGLFFVGQLIDLFLIPGMVKEGQTNTPPFLPKESTFIPLQFGQQVLEKLDRLDERLNNSFSHSKRVEPTPFHRLLETASNNHNVLSFAQAMMATGLGPDQVEQILNEGMRKGIIHVGNDPESGAVRYYFDI
jgi:hypothetical protein